MKNIYLPGLRLVMPEPIAVEDLPEQDDVKVIVYGKAYHTVRASEQPEEEETWH